MNLLGNCSLVYCCIVMLPLHTSMSLWAKLSQILKQCSSIKYLYSWKFCENWWQGKYIQTDLKAGQIASFHSILGSKGPASGHALLSSCSHGTGSFLPPGNAPQEFEGAWKPFLSKIKNEILRKNNKLPHVQLRKLQKLVYMLMWC